MKIKYEVSYSQVVNLILDKKIGAIHQGRSEIGQRALGNRSIIFDPTVPNGKDIINRVKNREKFRPFAGSILEEHSDEWFDMIGLKRSPFMTYNLRVKQDKKNIIPSIIHVDETCRIQTVSKEHNYHYYNLIHEFYNKTRVPILLNTSFNLSNQPIVETVKDAIKTLAGSEMSYVYFPDVQMMVIK